MWEERLEPIFYIVTLLFIQNLSISEAFITFFKVFQIGMKKIYIESFFVLRLGLRDLTE